MFPHLFRMDFTKTFPTEAGTIDEIMKPGREAFEFWISFFPTAPLFGVDWRFGDMMPKGGATAWSAPAPGAAEAAKVDANAKQGDAPSATPTEASTVVPVVLTAPTGRVAGKRSARKVAAKPTAPKPASKAGTQKPGIKAGHAETAADGRPVGLLATKPEKVDDLKLIKGIGPGLEKELNGLGIYTFEQMAGFGRADLEWIDEHLTAFKGRCFRDDWAGKAKALMR